MPSTPWRCLLLAWLALATVSDAADCTSAQVSQLMALSGNVTAVCGSDALSSTTSTAAAYCDNSECLAYLTSMASTVPSCEVESYNLRSVLATAISSCDAASDAVPAEKSGAQALQQLAATVLTFLAVAAIY
jgi:hypothetical protein